MKPYLFLLLIVLSGSHLSFGQFKLYEKGVEAYQSSNYPESIKLFTDYMSRTTRDKALDVQVYYLRALANFKSQKYAAAQDDFQEALLLNHENTGNIYWFLGKCQYNLADYNESIVHFGKALQTIKSPEAGTKSKLLYDRGLAYLKTADLMLAQEDLAAAADLDPNNTLAKDERDKLLLKTVASRATEKLPEPKTETKTPPVEKEKVKVKESEPEKKPEIKTEVALNKPEEKKPEVKTEPQVVAPPPVVEKPKEPTLADIYKDEKRYALVIGNSQYPKEIGMLKNPVNDATDIAKELENSNFEVQLLTNATYGQMRAAMLRFKEKVDAGQKDKTVALFYYAGHGLQQEDENYLVPVDASLEFEDDISRFCFPVQRMVLTNMERSNSRMNIVILDACRNNPFPALTRSLGDQGLAEMKRARGSFIAYATAPGSVASDGTGRNGLYTQELLKALRKPTLTIEQVFKEVRQNVLRLSGDRQNTWDSSNIVGEFFFKF
jgi:tetratricopeptide (TPR) repeat protein